MSARNVIAMRRLLAPTLASVSAATAPPAGTLTPSTVYEYFIACRDAAGNYSPRTSPVQGTAGSGGALLLNITVPVGPCVLVVWRGAAGTSVATPLRYLDVPCDSARVQIYDTGANLNGIPWKTTSIPTAPSSSVNQTYHGFFWPATSLVDGHGSGTPEAAITAPIGSRFTRTDGGAATTFYVKESGAGNTGWIAK